MQEFSSGSKKHIFNPHPTWISKCPQKKTLETLTVLKRAAGTSLWEVSSIELFPLLPGKVRYRFHSTEQGQDPQQLRCLLILTQKFL